jgi:uncharacterized protein
MRYFWFTVGLAATGCGIAGLALPLVPTTPFLLLAAYAFSRSSPGLHRWLVTHPRLGPPIGHWRAHGAISRPAKLLAGATILATLSVSLAAGVSGWLLGLQAVILLGVAIFLFTRPDPPSEAA